MTEEKNSHKGHRLKTIGLCSLVALFSLVLGGFGGYLIYHAVNGLDEDEKNLIDEYRILENEWIFQDDDLAADAMAGLANGVASGDSFTFYTPNMEDQNLSISHLGFGFTSHTYDGGLYLSEIHDGAAGKAGLERGDVLYGVTRGNESYYDFTKHTPTEVQNYLNEEGHEKDAYVFTYERHGERNTISLKKSAYSENLVEVEQEPTLENGYVLALRIPTFLGTPTKTVENTIRRYLNQGKSIHRLVIDLRGNGGGLVSECDSMAKLFVKKGTLIYELHGKDDNVLERSYQVNEPTFDIPKFDILLDGNSASASETFALSMRAGTDCTIHGFKSYGKGIAQKFHSFDDGSVLRFTYAYVYGPERENETMYDEGEDEDDILCIQGKGILPDVEATTPDYQWLSSVPSLLDSIAVGEGSQNFVLNLLNWLTDGEKKYCADYHFIDAIRDFSDYAYEKYQEEDLLEPFKEDGTVALPVFNKITKESYDLYLSYSQQLLEDTIHDR